MSVKKSEWVSKVLVTADFQSQMVKYKAVDCCKWLINFQLNIFIFLDNFVLNIELHKKGK